MKEEVAASAKASADVSLWRDRTAWQGEARIAEVRLATASPSSGGHEEWSELGSSGIDHRTGMRTNQSVLATASSSAKRPLADRRSEISGCKV